MREADLEGYSGWYGKTTPEKQLRRAGKTVEQKTLARDKSAYRRWLATPLHRLRYKGRRGSKSKCKRV